MRRKPRARSTVSAAVAVLAAATVATTVSAADAVPAPPRPPGSLSLQSVSASSETDAWSVGFHQRPGGNTEAITRHWDGRRWHTVPSAHPLEYGFLWDVADLAPDDAWAVGESIGGAQVLAFAEHWDGTSWTQVNLLGAPGLGTLNAVSAVAADDVWMVGTDEAGPRQTPRAFFAHWNGSTLHRVKAGRLTKARSSEIGAIAAVSADDVWAVGAHGRRGSTYLPLVEHYDGSAWTVVTSKSEPGTTTELSGVDGRESDDVWAVGWQAPDGQPAMSTLARHWDGSSWTTVPSAAPGYSSSLTSVSVLAEDDVWAAGTWQKTEGDHRARPLIEHWDGTSWSVVDAPSAGPGTSTTIQSVDLASPSLGFAVGETNSATSRTGYSVRYDGDVWSR